MDRLQVSAATIALMGILAFGSVLSVAADAPSDPDRSPVWKAVRQSLFGERVVAEDGGDAIVSLRAPTRAQDPSTVPIAISTLIDQTSASYVRKVYLLIDNNPSPIAAIFTFTPESGRADIQTRVRIEDYTWVRADRRVERRAAVHGHALRESGRRLLRAVRDCARLRCFPAPTQAQAGGLCCAGPADAGKFDDPASKLIRPRQRSGHPTLHPGLLRSHG